ncbi:hypothetical protein ACQ4LE_003793 [Meloidogyne hapla]
MPPQRPPEWSESPLFYDSQDEWLEQCNSLLHPLSDWRAHGEVKDVVIGYHYGTEIKEQQRLLKCKWNSCPAYLKTTTRISSVVKSALLSLNMCIQLAGRHRNFLPISKANQSLDLLGRNSVPGSDVFFLLCSGCASFLALMRCCSLCSVMSLLARGR